MKQISILLFMVLLAGSAISQTKGTALLYAYKQAVLPGVRKPSSEGPIDSSTVKPAYNYWIYLAASATVKPVELWLNGVRYGIKAEIVQSPVVQEVQTDEKKKTVLVPETGRKVWFLSPVEAQPEMQISHAKKLIQSNELVVVYQYKGRYFYRSVKTFKDLEAARRL